jgi:hypothetical protein
MNWRINRGRALAPSRKPVLKIPQPRDAVSGNEPNAGQEGKRYRQRRLNEN